MAARPFGNGTRKAELWGASSVKVLFDTRAVLGEYQPHTDRGGKRKKAGEPIRGYFPAVVSEAVFYAARNAIASRRGRVGGSKQKPRVSNLFTGLLKDARDGSPLNVVDKGGGPALVSSAAKKGAEGRCTCRTRTPRSSRRCWSGGSTCRWRTCCRRRAGRRPTTLPPRRGGWPPSFGLTATG